MLAELIGPDILIVLAVILVLFGGSQLPKLARGLGSAQKEFKKGLEEGHVEDQADKKTEKS
jgi:sec-independent protein translocase protein TatA